MKKKLNLHRQENYTCHTDAKIKPVTQMRKLNLSPGRKTKLVTQTRKLNYFVTHTCHTDRKLNSSHRRENQIYHTDAKTKFVTQTCHRGKLKLSHRREN